MAARKLNQNRYYTDGATAFKYQEEPVVIRKKRKVNKVKSNKKFNLASFFRVFALFLLLLSAISIIVLTLGTDNMVVESRMEINKLSRELANINLENEKLLNKINNATDFVKIKDIAMNEYGMIIPAKDDVLSVEISKSNYTVVYGDINKESGKEVDFYNVLAFITRGW